MKSTVLSWTNEASLTPYPLTKSFGYDGFLIDANFIQFDNFVPILKTIQLSDDMIDIVIQFDTITKTVSYARSEIAEVGTVKKIYDDADRYLGRVVFGSGVTKFISTVGNKTTLTVGVPFLSHTVKSIPSDVGVFALGGKYGTLTLSSDDYINYVVDGNDITFNAIALPTVTDELYLKTLNSTGPTNNSVFIKNTDLIKVTGDTSTVTISLVGTSIKGLTKANAIIVTSDGG